MNERRYLASDGKLAGALAKLTLTRELLGLITESGRLSFADGERRNAARIREAYPRIWQEALCEALHARLDDVERVLRGPASKRCEAWASGLPGERGPYWCDRGPGCTGRHHLVNEDGEERPDRGWAP